MSRQLDILLEAYLREKDQASLALDLLSFEYGKHDEIITSIKNQKKGRWRVRYVNETTWFYELVGNWHEEMQRLKEQESNIIRIAKRISEGI